MVAREVADVAGLLGALREREPGETVTVAVVRGGGTRDVEVELGELPE